MALQFERVLATVEVYTDGTGASVCTLAMRTSYSVRCAHAKIHFSLSSFDLCDLGGVARPVSSTAALSVL